MTTSPKRGLTRALGALTAAVCLTTVIAAPASASAEPPGASAPGAPSASDVARSFADDHAISEEEAVRRLTIQDRANRMLPQLKSALGDSFAGMWIAPDTGRVGVGLLEDRSVARSTIDQMIESHELSGDADIVVVRSSTADLQAAQYTLGIELASAIRDQRVRTEIDDAANRVKVVLDPRATKTDRARAEELRDGFARGREAYGPPLPPAQGSSAMGAPAPQRARPRTVALQLVAGRSLEIKPTVTCSSESCSPPLRAGVKIVNPGDGRRCSAGFIGRWWSGSRYEYFTMTAGHCIKGTNATWYWRAYNPATGNSNNIGQPWSWRYGANYGNVYPGLSLDIGIIHIDSGGYWGSPSNALWMHGWPSGVLWGVTSQAIAYQGQYGCRTGFASSYTCGTISTTTGTAAYSDGEGGVTNLLIVPGACAVGGDSGGAFVDGGTALGITSGSARNGDGSCAYGIFAHAEDVGNWLGVWALT